MKKLAVVMTILLILVSILRSQTTTGDLTGRVLDHDGKPVENANVLISGKNLIGNRGVVTDQSGQFNIIGLPSGLYNVVIDHAAYQSKSISEVRIPLGMTISLGDISLEMLTTDAIEVQTEVQAIDLRSTAIVQNYSVNQLDGLPLDRNYQTISKLLPQANESYYGDGVSIAGATGFENKYYINGVDVTDPVCGGASANLPYNFVQDVQIIKGGYEAEYRGSLGGLINVVTYSGGEDFSGQLYGYFTNNKFSGAALQSAYPPPEKYMQSDIGGSLGGPIIPGKLWFFTAYNPMIMRETVSVDGLGDFTDWRTAHVFAAKISWKMNDSNQFQFTLFGDPVFGEGVNANRGASTVTYKILNPELMLFQVEKGSLNATVNGTHIVNTNTLLQTSLSWSHFRDKAQGMVPTSLEEVYIQDDVNKTIAGYQPQGWDDSNVQIALAAKLTAKLNNHMFKTGFEFTSLNYATDTWVWVLTRPAENLYIESLQRRRGMLGQYLFGLFMQDTWSILDNLEFNAGLRWDPQLLWASNGQIAQKFLNQIAPRLGIIYTPGSGKRDKITISFGRFYQMLSMYIQQWYQLENTYYKMTAWDHDPRVDPAGGEVILTFGGTIQAEYSEMQGQHYDEFTAGYERQLEQYFKFSISGTYRTLRQGIEDGIDLSTWQPYFGNPGTKPLDNFPKMRREYSALELTLEHYGYSRFNFLLSYVLSRTYGNYPGVFDYYWRDSRTNGTAQFDVPDLLINATGLLGNDRTHVFKFFGSYSTGFGLTVGSSLSWMSGIPLSEYGGHWLGYPLSFLSPRGTQGRTPAIWDLNIRAVYELNSLIAVPLTTRLVIDVFHVGSPRTAVDSDQIHYFAVDENGNQINPNPEYLRPVQFQPPMSLRLGLELTF
jgi:hypothetical protein